MPLIAFKNHLVENRVYLCEIWSPYNSVVQLQTNEHFFPPLYKGQAKLALIREAEELQRYMLCYEMTAQFYKNILKLQRK